MPAYADSLVRLRHRYLRVQLGAMAARARMLRGEQLSFDQEARALYDATPPHYSDAHFDSLLSGSTAWSPEGPSRRAISASASASTFRRPLVDTVFKTAIAACRARTLAHLALPPGERFDLEYVKGTSWNAYNWYKGGYHSLIQVNLDFPIALDRAIDLACHEGYPGHHVYNALLEQALVRERGWVEISVYPLFSPQSFIAEGSANYGIDMAFPAGRADRFERDSLFPLAGLDTSLAERNAAVRQVIERLNYARNEVARRYLDGQIDSAGASAGDAALLAQLAGRLGQDGPLHQRLPRYVINYNLGATWCGRLGGADRGAGRRRGAGGRSESLLSAPLLPRDLVRGAPASGPGLRHGSSANRPEAGLRFVTPGTRIPYTMSPPNSSRSHRHPPRGPLGAAPFARARRVARGCLSISWFFAAHSEVRYQADALALGA